MGLAKKKEKKRFLKKIFFKFFKLNISDMPCHAKKNLKKKIEILCEIFLLLKQIIQAFPLCQRFIVIGDCITS